uniref:Ribosomal protein eL8/eL30/eS12/Gadd45 domain-containing protein n=1 Tax=Bos mutus grunniens TaxID=30521 RepID=A0A8C0A2X5_BOSMU
MTLEELVACDNAAQKMQTVSAAVEELLVAAQLQDRLTVGVYESAKLMNVDPDSVVLCLLAIDEEEEDDIALQIHFTLIQSFCCENDIDIVRVSGMQRLAQLLGEPAETQGTTEARDLHCLLVTVSKLGLRPAPPHPAPGPVFVNKVELAGVHQLSAQPRLACPVGNPLASRPLHPESYFEPACFPHGSPGRGKLPTHSWGLLLNPLFSLSHRTLTQTPGKATAWWRWPVTAKKVGGTTSGFPTSPSRSAETPPGIGNLLPKTKPHKYLTPPPSQNNPPSTTQPVRPSGAGSLETEDRRGSARPPQGGKLGAGGPAAATV